MKRGITFFSNALNLLSALIYLCFVGVLIALSIGNQTLNYALLGVTALFFVVFLVTILLDIKIDVSKRVYKTQRKIFKYTKFLLRLVNAAILVLGIASVRATSDSIIPLLGALYVFASFFVMSIIDVLIWLTKRQVKKLKARFNRQNKNDQSIETEE